MEDSAAVAVGTNKVNNPHALARLARHGAAMVQILCNHVYLVANNGGPAGFLCNRVYLVANVFWHAQILCHHVGSAAHVDFIRNVRLSFVKARGSTHKC